MARLSSTLSVVLIVAMLGAPAAGLIPRTCDQCPPDCPMHAHGLSCHHGHRMPCHRVRGLSGIFATCGHSGLADMDLPAARAVMSVTTVVSYFFSHAAPPPDPIALRSQVTPEPPTEPPRASRV